MAFRTQPALLAAILAITTGGVGPAAERGFAQGPSLRFAEQSVQPSAHWAPKEKPPEPSIPAAPQLVPHGPTLTLDELEQYALGNNPTLVQAAMRVRAAQGKCLQEGLYPNPVAGYQGFEMGDTGTMGQQGAVIGQEIVTAGKLGLRRAVAAHEVRQAEWACDAQRRRVLNDVRTAWYEVLTAQRALDLHHNLVQISREGVKAAEDLLKAKELSRVDVLEARVEAESADLRLLEARNRYQSAWRQLAATLGVDIQPARLEGDLESGLPEMTWEQCLTSLLAESPELAQARAGLERARCNVARQCAERVPNLQAEAAVRYALVPEDTVADFTLTLPLPIHNRNQGNIAKAHAELIAAEQEVRRVELSLQQRLATAFERYANSQQQAQKYTAAILPNAKDSLDLILKGYRQGELSYVQLLTAQQTYFRVNLSYLESLRELRASSVAIEGLLLSGALEAISGGGGE